MQKQEYQAIARSQIKAIQPMGIKREEKIAIYYSLISGFMQCQDFQRHELAGLDKLLDEAINEYKMRTRCKL